MALHKGDPRTRAIARKGGLTRVAREGGRAVAAPARRGFEAALERAVDPDGVLSPEDRAQRAAAELRIRMADLARRRWAARPNTEEGAT